MKKSLVYAALACTLAIPQAHALDWGLSSKITAGIKNIFSKAAEEETTKVNEQHQKEAETLSQFLESARTAGYITATGEVDYNRINNDPQMVARLTSVMNNIEPAAGPMSTQEQPILHLKPEKTDLEGELRIIAK